MPDPPVFKNGMEVSFRAGPGLVGIVTARQESSAGVLYQVGWFYEGIYYQAWLDGCELETSAHVPIGFVGAPPCKPPA